MKCQKWTDQHGTSVGQRNRTNDLTPFSHFITDLKIHHLYSFYHAHDDFDSTDSSRRLSYTNSVKWPCSPRLLVAQWIEPSRGVREVMGSIPVGDSHFCFGPRWSVHFSIVWLFCRPMWSVNKVQVDMLPSQAHKKQKAGAHTKAPTLKWEKNGTKNHIIAIVQSCSVRLWL